MKIIAPVYDTGGSYHRVKLPLTFFKDHEVIFTDGLIEDFLKDTDVVFLHWSTNLKPWYISCLRQKYGFKVIVDIDDSWDIPKNHIEYAKVMKGVSVSKKFAAMADFVITPNKLLVEDISKINPRVVYIPNRIPYGYEQFKIKNETWEDFNKRKIRVGVAGGTNHYWDWLSIKEHIHKLLKDDYFNANCYFIFSGYRDDRFWNSLKKEFPKAVFIPGKPVENYIQVYNLDIMLCPLEDNNFNKRKSDLKVLESAVNETITLLDPQYEYLLSAEDTYNAVYTKDWYKDVMNCIKDKEQLYTAKKYESNLLLDLDYIKDAVQPRIDLLTKEVQTFSDYELKSITYADDQLYDFTEYKNNISSIEEKSYLFEYNVLLDVIPTMKGKYIGAFSHKFGLKTDFSRYEVETILEKEKVDVISFCKPIPDYLKWTNKVHPGFEWRFRLLCSRLGLKYKEPKISIYSNFFVAKPEVYMNYLEFLKKAINELEKEDYKCWQPVNYKGLSPELLKKYTGLDFYTWHTFLLERLISLWTEQKKLKVRNYS